CGAIVHLTMGQHADPSLFVIRTIVGVIYVPIGWFVPVASHWALTHHALGETASALSAFAKASDPVIFLAAYAVLSVIAALVVYRLLIHKRRRLAASDDRAGFKEAAT